MYTNLYILQFMHTLILMKELILILFLSKTWIKISAESIF